MFRKILDTGEAGENVGTSYFVVLKKRTSSEEWLSVSQVLSLHTRSLSAEVYVLSEKRRRWTSHSIL